MMFSHLFHVLTVFFFGGVVAAVLNKSSWVGQFGSGSLSMP